MTDSHKLFTNFPGQKLLQTAVVEKNGAVPFEGAGQRRAKFFRLLNWQVLLWSQRLFCGLINGSGLCGVVSLKPVHRGLLMVVGWVDSMRQRNYTVDEGGGWGYRLLAAQAVGVSSASR